MHGISEALRFESISHSFAATQLCPQPISSAHNSRFAHNSLFTPSTCPTTLYRFEKKVIQSSNTFFLSSSRSFQSGRTSSGFVDERARAREASWPANTVYIVSDYFIQLSPDKSEVKYKVRFTVITATRRIHLVPRYIEDLPFDCYIGKVSFFLTYAKIQISAFPIPSCCRCLHLFLKLDSRGRRISLPVHFERNSTEIGSSLGGFKVTVVLGSNLPPVILEIDIGLTAWMDF